MAEDSDLLRGAQRFDRKALAEIYDTYSPGLYRYAMRLLGDPNLSEDCVAETFSRFLAALRTGKGPQIFLQAYLYRVAHNWITDQYRRQPSAPVELTEAHRDESPNPEDTVGHHLKQEIIRAALHRLTPDQQQVIVLKFLEDCENQDIAHALHKPIGAIKSLQHRALASLRHVLQDEDLL